MARWISAIWTRQLIRVAEAHGADPAPLWKRAGIGPNDADPMLRLPDDVHLGLWSDVMRAVGDPGFPIDYAARMRIDDYDALGLACKTAESVGVALDRILRYLRIWTNSVELSLEGSRVVLLRSGLPDVGYRAAMESSLAEVLQAVRGFTNDAIIAERVSLAHSTGSISLARHREFFGVTPDVGASEYALELSTETLNRPLALADPGLSQFMLGHLERLASQALPDPPFEERVADAIVRELPSGAPQAARVALLLGVSTRTLQRTLEQSGKTFQQVVSETREALAKRLLLETPQSLAEISFLLGFSEVSAFHRAFKRWTGRTPNEWRAKGDGS